MVTKIFLTGATGYIGGDALYAIAQAHPGKYAFTLFVRSEERATPVKAQYPDAKFVYGTLDDVDVIEKAAAEADIVIHTANSADHEASAKAIAKGLAAGHSAEKPGYWIHISGTGILQWRDQAESRFGQPPLPDERYDDIDDLARIHSLPDAAIHRPVDKIVLAAQAAAATTGIRAAIVSPPTIFGPGRGPVNTRSIQVYDLVKFALLYGFVPLVGTGQTKWDHVHVADLSELTRRLVERAAAAGDDGGDDEDLFGDKGGYFFVETDSHRWGDVSQWVTDEINRQRLTASPIQIQQVSDIKDVMKEGVPAAPTWGLNSQSSASRARKFLEWKPTHGGLKEAIPEAVASEAARLGIKSLGAA